MEYMLVLTIKYLIELQNVLLPLFEGFPLDAHVVLPYPWCATESGLEKRHMCKTAGGLDQGSFCANANKVWDIICPLEDGQQDPFYSTRVSLSPLDFY